MPVEWSAVRNHRLAVAAIFFLNGAMLGSFASRIPALKEAHRLSEATLGLALLAIAAGAVLAMPLSGGLIARLGSRLMTTLMVLLFLGQMVLVAVAPNMLLLVPALFLLGAFNGTLDVSMNSQGVAVEKLHGSPILSSFHAAWSFGSLAGAAAGAGVIWLGVGFRVHLIAMAVLLFVCAVVAAGRLLPTTADAQDRTPAFARPTGKLVLLGAVVFCGMLSEGAMADWSAVYIAGPLGAEQFIAALGFTAFSLTMAFTRVFGDRLAAAWGPTKMTRRSGLLAAGGLAFALVIGTPWAAIVGFALVGAGLGNIVPVVFSAAGRVQGVASGTALAAVATTGYTGFLAGPPLIGLTAQVTSLPLALGVVVIFCALVALLASSVGSADTETQPGAVEAGVVGT